MDFYSGWENYYRQATESAWREEPDEAVLDLQERVAAIASPHVADLGCGDGRNAWPWIRGHGSVVCVDFSATALQRILNRCADQRLRMPTLLECDMSRTPLACGQFDIVQCYDALPQIASPSQGLAEARRILRTGGLFGFNVFTVADDAYGLGEKIEENAYVFNDTLFRFFEDGEVERMLPEGLRVVDQRKKRWKDPPHVPFRPWEHEHEALFFVCERVA